MAEMHLERQMRQELESLRNEMNQRLFVLETPSRVTANLIASPNYILNSHPEWSKAAWENTGVSGGTVTDANRTCYNWFYQEESQTTLSSSTTVTATQGPLIADGHASFATPNADAGIWDQVNSRFEVGWTTTAYDIACPLSRDFVFPGHRYYIYFETIALESGLDLQGAEFYCGFWDNTSNQRKWIQGADFTPNATVFGALGTRTLAYKILAATDGGEEILSTEVSVPNAPATLSVTNHVRLSLAGAPGFIQFKVYRFDGLQYRLVGDIRNSIDLQFYDMDENAGSLAAGWPTASGARPLAKEATTSLLATSTGYTAHTMVVQIPTTYNKNNTGNNQQWFRWGLTGPISAARKLGIRRIMVSEGYGPWVRAQGDLTIPLSSPSSTAASSPVSTTTIGTSPSNGNYCVTLDTLIDTIKNVNGVDLVVQVPISHVNVGTVLVCGTNTSRVKYVMDGVVQETYTLTTEAGLSVTCSESHRFLRSRLDVTGTPVGAFKVGDTIVTCVDDVVGQDKVTSIEVVPGAVKVRSLSLPAPHLFVTNGIVSHNTKEPVERQSNVELQL